MVIPLHKYQNLVDSYTGNDLIKDLPSKLCSIWEEAYIADFPKANLTGVNLNEHGSSQSYIFDITLGRNLVAFGVPTYVAEKRDSGRQKGHPKNAGYVKGHLIGHALGGGMDINFIPQLRKTNAGGDFKKLELHAEKLAREGVRALYFVRCDYSNDSQTPVALEQCVIEAPRMVRYTVVANV